MKLIKAMVALSLLVSAPASFAALSSSYQFNGQGNWSIDAAGDITGWSRLRATVPTGSTVEQAFLYSSTYFNTPRPVLEFGGEVIAGASRWTALGMTGGPVNGLQAFRADVTAQVASAVAGGGEFLFNVIEMAGGIDGQVLAVVYSNPDEVERQINLFDGYADTFGDETALTLDDPLTGELLGDADFEASLSLGIGFGAQPTFIPQQSEIDINGVRVSTAAGGQDDGQFGNGGQITVGDTYDDDFASNPENPNAFPTTARSDDEAYNLAPFLSEGDSLITLQTRNPSADDNIFFAGFNITTDLDPDSGGGTPPPGEVSEPGTLVLMLLGFMGLAAARRRRI